MAIRFRKSVKVMPGVRVNFGKKGMSTSIGARGATVNLSKRGTRVTAGLPGTGLSVSHLYKAQSSKRQPAPIKPVTPKLHIRHSPAEWAVAAFFVELAALVFWKHLSGAASAIGAIVALGIPGIYIIRWIRKQKQEGKPTLQPATIGESAHAPPVQDAPQESPAQHWTEIVKEHRARQKLSSERTAIIPVSAADDVVATPQSAAALSVDYLGKAAQIGDDAGAAVRAGRLDTAWGLFHEQKALYLQHAQAQGWNRRDTFALDASVHEQLANILRLEKRHADALAHILYWISANRHRPIKKHSDKLRSYFNRCKLSNTSLEQVESYLASRRGSIGLSTAQRQVKSWIEGG